MTPRLHTPLPALPGLLGLVLLALAGCGPEGDLTQWECAPTGDGETCAGVSHPRICDDSFCTAALACKRVHRVQQHLATAVAAARAGDCIALAAGTYEPVILPAGVSLLGSGAGEVTISGGKALVVKGGQGAVLRGFTVSGRGRGLALQSVKGARIQQVRITGARALALEVNASQVTMDQVEVSKTGPTTDGKYGVGVQLTGGSQLRVTRSWLTDSASVGLYVHESSLELTDSVVERSGQLGVYITCSKACGASSLLRATVRESTERGVSVSGARLLAKEVEVAYTRAGERGGTALGVGAVEGADLTLVSSKVHHTDGFGVLLDGATGQIASTTVEQSAMAGLWIQRIKAGAVQLLDNTVRDSKLAGVGLYEARGVTLQGGSIQRTAMGALLTTTSSISAGDGIQVLAGSSAAVIGVTVESSARVGVLFDSSAGKVIGCTIDGHGSPLVFQRPGASPPVALDNRDPEAEALSPLAPGKPYPVPVAPF